MHFTPEEMTRFVNQHLGPRLEADGKGDLIILGYDQNRQGVQEWRMLCTRMISQKNITAVWFPIGMKALTITFQMN